MPQANFTFAKQILHCVSNFTGHQAYFTIPVYRNDKQEFDGQLWILSGVYMDILEQIRAWLEIRGYLPGIDSCGLAPGETGLFPLGMEQRSLREDVLGNRVRKMRYTFLLRITAVPGERAARNCLQLQTDAQNFPEPGITLRAEKGRLVKKTSTGLGIYELRLTAEREERL